MRSIKHAAIAVALTAVLASCSDDTTSEAKKDDNGSGTQTPLAQCQFPVGSEDPLTPGCWTIQADGLAGGPRAELDLPAGFQGSDWGVWLEPPKPEDWGNIALRMTGDVYRDPCHRAGSPATGPTVEDFTRALDAQKLTHTTTAVPVKVDGYAGLYVEVSVPAGVDLSGCPDEQLLLWPGDETSAVSHEFMHRYWVLDVDGQRMVLVVTTHPNATKKAVAFLSRIVESATFAEG